MVAQKGAGDGVLGAAALFAATLVWFSLPEDVRAQDTTTTTTLNATNVTQVCHTKCCDSKALAVEARLACQEFRNWGVQDSTCVLWQMNAKRFCKESCSNCTTIAKAMYDQCLFFLQSQMDFMQAMDYCRVVESDFQNAGRCTSACNTTVDECYSEKGRNCMKTCGNYQDCECWKWRGVFGTPDSCSGNTVIQGYVEDPATGISIKPLTRHGCYRIGDKCKNHLEGRECGKYKWCETDMCLVKQVTCPIVDSCQKYGACLKATGECYYTLRDDGVTCTDGLFYTHDDTCVGGKCIGWVDRCLRDDVQCGTTNPCLKPQGTCHPVTGACQFEKQPDDTPCASQPKRALDGKCDSGLCRRNVLDLCAGKNCSHLGGYCFKDPKCDPTTGQCVIESRPEGMQCTPADNQTFMAMCIEGDCIGHRFETPKFKKIADGFCADEKGNMLQRYFADTFDEAECADQCAKDPSCVAYSFGFHFCSIYGGVRSRHPSTRWWGGTLWKLGSVWGDTSITAEEASAVTPAEPSQQLVSCMKKVGWLAVVKEEKDLGREIAFGILLTLLGCTPGIWMFLAKMRQHKDPDDEDESDDGDFYEDSSDAKQLAVFEAAGSIHDAQQEAARLSSEPLASPRNGNSSAVAMAPPMIEAPAAGGALWDADGTLCDAVAVPPGSVDDATLDAVDDGVEASDPRGEVEPPLF